MAPKQTQNIGNTSYILKLEKIHITKIPIFPKTSYTVSAIPTQVQWQPSRTQKQALKYVWTQRP